MTEKEVLLQSAGQLQTWAVLGIQVCRMARAREKAREKLAACQGLHTAPSGVGGSDQGVQPGCGFEGNLI